MTTSPEHRIETRLNLEATIFLEMLSDQTDILMCNSLDLSATGLQVLVDDEIETGSIVRLCIDLAKRDPIYLVAEVMWVRPDHKEEATRLGLSLFESDDIGAWKELVAEMLN